MHLTKEQNKALDNLITHLLYFVSNGSNRVTTEYLFKKIWQLLYKQLLTNDLVETIDLAEINTGLYGPYLLNIREFLLLKIITIFRKHNISYSPMIVAENAALLNQIKINNKPCIFVSTHNGFAHNIKVLTHLGRKVNTIGLQPYTDMALNRSGIPSGIKIINQDRYCLAYAKKSIVEGALISSTVDFKANNIGPFKLISPVMFDFAKKLNVDLYFSKSEVLENGKVKLNYKLSENSASPEETANQFIQYCTSGSSKKSLVVQDFNQNLTN